MRTYLSVCMYRLVNWCSLIYTVALNKRLICRLVNWHILITLHGATTTKAASSFAKFGDIGWRIYPVYDFHGVSVIDTKGCRVFLSSTFFLGAFLRFPVRLGVCKGCPDPLCSEQTGVKFLTFLSIFTECQ